MDQTPITLTWDHVIVALIMLLLGFLLRWLWIRVRPWVHHPFIDCRLREGTWMGEAVSSTGEKTTDILNLRRTAYWCSGNITVAGASTGSYEFEGTFRGDIFSAVFQPSDDKRLNRGVIGLLLDEKGTCLQGLCVHYDNTQTPPKMVAQQYTLHLQDAI